LRNNWRKGTATYEASPENVITREAPQYRLVPDKLWADANAISDQSAANTWRDASGRLKSRATKSPHLLSPFIACVCGSPLHAKQSGKGDKKRWLYTCTRHHLLGNKACAQGRGIRVEWLDRAILDSFESALVGHVVLGELQEVLGESKRRAIDLAPLKAEADKLKKEIARLVDSLASGELEDVHDAIRARKARLEHLQGTLQGLGTVKEFDLAAFAEKVTPILADWRTHLKKNHATAAQVLRKLIPHRLTVTRTERGGLGPGDRHDEHDEREEGDQRQLHDEPPCGITRRRPESAREICCARQRPPRAGARRPGCANIRC
jgi:Recombinase zinc beta ribbon domain